MTNRHRSKLCRRDMLKATAAGLAIPTVVPGEILGNPNDSGSNDRLRIGVIGTGGRGTDMIRSSTPVSQMRLVALADCDVRRMEGFVDVTRDIFPEAAECNRYQDYRKMFDEEKLDGVFVATPTHGRVLPMIHACQAGVDVYAEKPITLTIEEGQMLIKAVRKHKRIFQAGTQARSLPVNRWAVQQVQQGAIGKIVKALVPNFNTPIDYLPQKAQPVPDGLDWDMWCNQAPLYPCNPMLATGLSQWGLYSQFDGGGSSGGMTGTGTHAFDQIQWAIGKDDTSPIEIWTTEPDGPNCPVVMRYADGQVLEMMTEPGAGPRFGGIFIGEQGKVEINRNVMRSNPVEIAQAMPAFNNSYEGKDDTGYHIADWFNSIRTRRDPSCPVETAHRHSVLCHLANIARQLKRRLRYDPKVDRFVGDGEANNHPIVSRPRREGYELPNL